MAIYLSVGLGFVFVLLLFFFQIDYPYFNSYRIPLSKEIKETNEQLKLYVAGLLLHVLSFSCLVFAARLILACICMWVFD